MQLPRFFWWVMFLMCCAGLGAWLWAVWESKRCKNLSFIVSRPEEKKIFAILEKLGRDKEDLKCSICDDDLEPEEVRAIFPSHGVLICCNKVECLLGCRDRLKDRGG